MSITDEHLADHGITRAQWDVVVRRTASRLTAHAEHTLDWDDCGDCIRCQDCDQLVGGRSSLSDALERGFVTDVGNIVIGEPARVHPLGPGVARHLRVV